jgi:uncharacterized protein (TIGR02611 family)
MTQESLNDDPCHNSDDHYMTLALARRVVIAIIGGTVLLLGIAMLLLPGPGLLVIPAGLGILAIEFVWARKWMRLVRLKTHQALSAKRKYLRRP